MQVSIWTSVPSVPLLFEIKCLRLKNEGLKMHLTLSKSTNILQYVSLQTSFSSVRQSQWAISFWKQTKYASHVGSIIMILYRRCLFRRTTFFNLLFMIKSCIITTILPDLNPILITTRTSTTHTVYTTSCLNEDTTLWHYKSRNN